MNKFEERYNFKKYDVFVLKEIHPNGTYYNRPSLIRRNFSFTKYVDNKGIGGFLLGKEGGMLSHYTFTNVEISLPNTKQTSELC